MTTTTTPRANRGRRVAAVAAAGVAALAATAALALPVGERTESAGADPTAVSVESTTSSAVEATTTTTLNPRVQLEAWYAGLTPEERLAFDLMAASDEDRAAWSAWVSGPAPAPEPVPAPEPEPAPAPEPAPEPAPAAVVPAGPPPAPVTCGSFGSQDEATAWLQANAGAFDMRAIDSNGDGIPCTAAFAPATPAPSSSAAATGPANSFLACVMQRESRGDYGAVNSSSGAGGAYQFLQSTWNNTARHAGRGDLVGVHPSNAAPGDQDAMALHLYQWQGRAPWAGGGC